MGTAKRRSPRKWTTEDQRRSTELRAQGWGYRRIARAINRDPATVRDRLTCRFDGPRHWYTEQEICAVQEMRAAGKKPAEIATAISRSVASISAKLSRLKHPGNPWQRWSETDIERAIAYNANGKSAAWIAAKLRRPRLGVQIVLTRHRKRVLADPRKRRVLQALAFATDPGRILAALRDARILDGFDKEVSV